MPRTGPRPAGHGGNDQPEASSFKYGTNGWGDEDGADSHGVSMSRLGKNGREN